MPGRDRGLIALAREMDPGSPAHREEHLDRQQLADQVAEARRGGKARARAAWPDRASGSSAMAASAGLATHTGVLSTGRESFLVAWTLLSSDPPSSSNFVLPETPRLQPVVQRRYGEQIPTDSNPMRASIFVSLLFLPSITALACDAKDSKPDAEAKPNQPAKSEVEAAVDRSAQAADHAVEASDKAAEAVRAAAGAAGADAAAAGDLAAAAIEAAGAAGTPAAAGAGAASCAVGKCTQSCDSGDCRHSCSGGSCTQTCEAGATCRLACSGGECTQTCKSGASCTMACSGGDCTQSCEDGTKQCKKSCSGDGCKS